MSTVEGQCCIGYSRLTFGSAIAEDPTQFVKWEMITGAKLATVMAVAIWTIPLAAVFSPATLTSEMGTFVENRTCSAVPSLDFTAGMVSLLLRDVRRLMSADGLQKWTRIIDSPN